ncbi:SMP-30/gluconolactonase/LRE family protein [Cumulibacter soli]|uniref:SMP-30/gluconolactonase/LRE family protein n=1 Tax=Cumulibacter soli TaxID=2546344 RepID=UPI001ABB42E2|nr:SMP-30/gluconolactonase/LRE family protein [Cumulibacter soli]
MPAASQPDPMPQVREITRELDFPEGPIAMSDGSVILVEIKRGTLSRVSPDGDISVIAELGGGPNGAALGPDGAVYVCNNGGFEWHQRGELTAPGGEPDDYIGGRIQRVVIDGPDAGQVTDLYTECEGRKLRGPNDIVFDTTGGFWFTDLGKHKDRKSDTSVLYYAAADGSKITEVVHPLTSANGVGLSPDGSRVYVAETHTGRVWAWDIDQPGSVRRDGVGPGGGHLMHGFSGYQLLDSLAVDGDGNVCVATLVTGAVSAISPKGELLYQIPVPEHDFFVTNICFVGGDSHKAFVTSSGLGRLYEVQWPSRGLDLAYSA